VLSDQAERRRKFTSIRATAVDIHADISVVNMPMGPLTVPTDAELALLLTSEYQTDVAVRGRQTRRRFQSVATLTAVAALVFAYDVLSVVLGR
jgi:hypothetical protein